MKNAAYFIMFFITICFIVLLIRFHYKSELSIKGLEQIIPIFGALLFGIYYLLSTEYKLKKSEESNVNYAAIFFIDKNKVNAPPLFFLNSDPNVSAKRFYFKLHINSSSLNLIYPNGLSQRDQLDFFEHNFIENFPINYNGSLSSNQITLYDILNQDKKNSNKFTHYPLTKLQELQNKVPNGPRTNVSHFESFKGHKINIPQSCYVTYTYEEDRRIYKIIHPLFSIEFYIWHGGLLNIRPDFHISHIHKFHKWITSSDDTNLVSPTKFYISTIFKKSKFFSISDDYEEYNKYFQEIIHNIQKDFSWELAENELREQYQLKLMEDILATAKPQYR